ncbi:MAG: hypothetical protein AAF840_10390, partial [Bacteroidota bacterium]
DEVQFLKIKSSKAYSLSFEASNDEKVNVTSMDFGFGIVKRGNTLIKLEGLFKYYEDFSKNYLKGIPSCHPTGRDKVFYGYAIQKDNVWSIDLSFQREKIYQLEDDLVLLYSDFEQN